MISIEKPRLPKGLSYVVKTSLLQVALDEAGIDCHIDLKYWVPQSGASVLQAHYWLPNAKVPYPRVYLRAGVVPSSERRGAADALEESVLPAFINWLSRILALPVNSPLLQREPYFDAVYREGRFEISHNVRI